MFTAVEIPVTKLGAETGARIIRKIAKRLEDSLESQMGSDGKEYWRATIAETRALTEALRNIVEITAAN